MRFLLAIAIALLIVCAASAGDKPEREVFDDAIDRGLEYLSSHQGPDGSCSSRSGRDPAVTSLAIMAYLSAGHVPGEGKYGTTVEKGIKFVLDQQRNGVFSGQFQGQMEMYQHGICTLMVAEVVGMIADRREAKRLRGRLELAIATILKAQVRRGEDRGGWRYTTRSIDSDISVTGWQLMALRAAKNVGCDIPAEQIDQAIDYINRCHDSLTGGYRYQRFGGVTIPCTGTSVLALELTSKEHHGSQEALKAGSYLLKNPLNPRQRHFFYGIYYTSQATFQLGDNYWTIYRKNLHDLLLRQNPPKAAGFWSGWGWDDSDFGPNYCTAMAILALAVEYRFLPIYQRNEEPMDKESPKP